MFSHEHYKLNKMAATGYVGLVIKFNFLVTLSLARIFLLGYIATVHFMLEIKQR